MHVLLLRSDQDYFQLGASSQRYYHALVIQTFDHAHIYASMHVCKDGVFVCLLVHLVCLQEFMHAYVVYTMLIVNH